MKTAKIVTFLLLSVVLTERAKCASEDVITRTTDGDIRGLRTSVLGRQVDVYWGVPYAKRPSRFQPAERGEPWQGVLQAVTPPPSCPEIPYPGTIPLLQPPSTPFDEDCLFLNVWVPLGCEEAGSLAVMVWIHGGGFEWGSTTVPTYNGQVLAATQCVIVASMNYRLGPLGFLSLGNERAPGNVGLRDQALALEWIQDNAARFGGSPDTITLFGESAGALSVGTHMVSPVSRDLFRRAIMQSGPPGSPWAKKTVAQNAEAAKKLATLANCPADDDDAMVTCLSLVDLVELERAVMKLKQPNDIAFGLIVDGHFLPEPVNEPFVQGAVNQFDVMVGVTKNDAAFIPPLFTGEAGNARPSMSRSAFQQFVKDIVLKFLVDRPGDSQLAAQLIEFLYVNSTVPSQSDYHTAMENIFLDLNFACPMYTVTKPFVGKRGVFMYSFDHRSSVTQFPEWMGVVHASELDLVFGRPLDQEEQFTDNERLLSKVMMTAWANFAKSG